MNEYDIELPAMSATVKYTIEPGQKATRDDCEGFPAHVTIEAVYIGSIVAVDILHALDYSEINRIENEIMKHERNSI